MIGPLRPGRWKLWHLAALVLASALAFGLIRALSSTPEGRLFGGLWGGLMAAVGIVTASDRARRRRRQESRNLRPPSGLKGWGVRQGGPVGFLAWLLGIGLDMALVLVVIALVALAFLLFGSWFANLA